AKVDVVMDSGATFSARCQHPLGSAENPLSRRQIEQKFRGYAQGVIADAHIDDVIAAVDRLEDFGSVRKLMEWLVGAPATHAMAAAE
ncbi:MAG: hypothetical protein WAK35_21440, partial [Xanthobacteraceae bacterium]